jgi:hypothetical protein
MNAAARLKDLAWAKVALPARRRNGEDEEKVE